MGQWRSRGLEGEYVLYLVAMSVFCEFAAVWCVVIMYK